MSVYDVLLLLAALAGYDVGKSLVSWLFRRSLSAYREEAEAIRRTYPR